MRREHGEHTLQTTAIVHEAYLRICRSEPIDWKDRAHFYAVAHSSYGGFWWTMHAAGAGLVGAKTFG